ncbi:MAG: ABC transporter permease [Opitutales bacterium]
MLSVSVRDSENAWFKIEEVGPQKVAVCLYGEWDIAKGLPVWRDVEQALSSFQNIKHVCFEVDNLSMWDSSLPTFIIKCENYCEASKIHFDDTHLPSGLRNLLELSRAIPEAEIEQDEKHKHFLYRLGETCLNFFHHSVEILTFLGLSFVSVGRFFAGRAQFRKKDFFLILQQCGADALPIVTLISFLVGFTLAFVGAVQLQAFGADVYVANLVGLGMVREMGAMMAAIIMCGRSGAAFASQIGSMKVSEEIDALETLGISPIDFLVLPRMIALFFMMPLLCLYADFVGIFGGITVGIGMLDLTYTQYIKQTQAAIDLADFSTGVIKSTVFGALVVVTGCLRGMQCGRSSAAVGVAATSAVVSGITAIVVADSLFTLIFNALGI